MAKERFTHPLLSQEVESGDVIHISNDGISAPFRFEQFTKSEGDDEGEYEFTLTPTNETMYLRESEFEDLLSNADSLSHTDSH